MTKKQIKLTADQVEELTTLCEVVKAAEEALSNPGRFKAFMEDNKDALMEGIEVAGLRLGILDSKRLTIEFED